MMSELSPSLTEQRGYDISAGSITTEQLLQVCPLHDSLGVISGPIWSLLLMWQRHFSEALRINALKSHKSSPRAENQSSIYLWWQDEDKEENTEKRTVWLRK